MDAIEIVNAITALVAEDQIGNEDGDEPVIRRIAVRGGAGIVERVERGEQAVRGDKQAPAEPVILLITD